MLAGFLLLLLLTGGSSSDVTEPPGDQQTYNESSTGGGSTYNDPTPDSNRRGNSYGVTDPPGDQQMYNESSTGAQWSPKCSYETLVNHLNLTNKVKFAMIRPVEDHRKTTKVGITLSIKAILDVIEKEQKLVSYVTVKTNWVNDFIKWNAFDFCLMQMISLPRELLWKPDIYIQEMTGKDKSSTIHSIFVDANGFATLFDDMVLESTCRMRFYKFPLDTQICNFTFMAVSTLDIELIGLEGRRNLDESMSEWHLLDVTTDHDSRPDFPSIIYSLKIKRQSMLYILNFILPILFFLCLDLASFLISENGGEKLSFKVTVLLAVTVMQLILNDILPSSSDRIPLIAVYCIGTFILMMMSLLETILVMYLMERDSVSQDKDAEKDQSLKEDCTDKHGKLQNCFRDINKWVHSTCVSDVSLSETPSELLPVAKEGSSSRVSEECQLEKLSEELREVKLLLSIRKDEDKPGYWTRMTKTINRIYMIVYVITASVFFGVLFSRWFAEENY